MHHEICEAEAVTNNNTKDKNSQYVNVFELKTDGVTSKLVNWAVQKDSGKFQKVNLKKLI